MDIWRLPAYEAMGPQRRGRGRSRRRGYVAGACRNRPQLQHKQVDDSEAIHVSRRTILYFVKFFKDESHADQFLKGQLYLNRLSYFRKIESADDGRLDATEAVTMWWQPDDLIIKFSGPNCPEIEITKADLAGPVSVSFE